MHRWLWIIFIIWGQVATLNAQACMESRLVEGGQAQVVGTPNRLRDAPSVSATRIGEIPAGRPFIVLEVGGCENDIRWVRVRYEGQEGWTAEAVGTEYYLVPVAAALDEAMADTASPPPVDSSTTDPRLSEIVNQLNTALWRGGCGLPPSIAHNSQITPVNDAVRIRQSPSTQAAVVGSIPARGRAQVRSPIAICNEGYTWRYVLQLGRGDDFTYGWIAESDANDTFVQADSASVTLRPPGLEARALAWAGNQVLVGMSEPVGVLIVPADADGSAPMRVLWGTDAALQSPFNPAMAWVQVGKLGFVYDSATNTLSNSLDLTTISAISVVASQWTEQGLLLSRSDFFLLIDPETGAKLNEFDTEQLDPPGLRTRFPSPRAAYNPTLNKVGLALIATFSDDGFIGFFDPTSNVYTPLATGSDAQRLYVRDRVDNTNIRDEAFSPRGTFFRSFNTLWDVATGAQLHQLPTQALAFSFDDRYVVISDAVVEARTGERVFALPNVSVASFNVEGTRLAVARSVSGGFVLHIYATDSWELLNTMNFSWLGY
jgi:uncharacterized protein YraI